MNCITFTKINTTKKINNSDIKHRKKLDYKKLGLTVKIISTRQKKNKKKYQKNNNKQKLIQMNLVNILLKKKHINKELFVKHFNYQKPIDMLNHMYETNDINNSKLVSVIFSGIKDLKKEIKEMPKEEKETEKPENIVDIVEEILKFNKQYQEGQGMKILTPNQMLS